MNPQIILTEAEWKIMSVLWEKSPQTITQLVKNLEKLTGWAKSTVITLLWRMREKGAVAYEEGPRAKLFYPTVTREALAPLETASFLGRIYDGSVSMMVNTLIMNNSLSENEIAELKSILEKAGK